ncbi:hypothetical protein chiPu_0002638 [Chiloscyllium punctatum]|uniref:Uncharacterized protein n=1 Tax=Chiloscyllium punctatum TaxID=137246 RepID=A0A401S1I7_CHIPU|nr:hypothetical protein [Chiloscyllium punctatum]
MATVLPQQDNSNTYTFSSRPRALQERRKYRQEQQQQCPAGYYGNIMYDRRVVRGNTYAQHTLPAWTPILSASLLLLSLSK